MIVDSEGQWSFPPTTRQKMKMQYVKIYSYE